MSLTPFTSFAVLTNGECCRCRSLRSLTESAGAFSRLLTAVVVRFALQSNIPSVLSEQDNSRDDRAVAGVDVVRLACDA